MMNDNEDLISRLRTIGRRPVNTDVAAAHLSAMRDPAGAGASWAGRHRLKIVAAFAVGLMVGTSGLATAGALPNGAQEVAHRTLGAVGVKVPHGDRYQGPECAGVVKNHGQYVKSQPKEKRAEAAKSRCGKPVQAGGVDDTADQPKGTGCQGPPPWAGKGKPDPAAKAARKQACGDGDDSDGKKETPAPATVAQPAPLTQEQAPTTDPSTPTTVTTETTSTSETTATTATTGPLQGDTTPTTPVDPPVPGLGS